MKSETFQERAILQKYLRVLKFNLNIIQVYEATNYMSKKKFALKTIEKKVLLKSERNFVRYK